MKNVQKLAIDIQRMILLTQFKRNDEVLARFTEVDSRADMICGMKAVAEKGVENEI